MIDRDNLQTHIRSLHRYACGLMGDPTDADDLVQECLRRVLDRIDRETPIRNLRAYLFQTLRNVHIDHCRQAKARRNDVAAETCTHAALVAVPTQEDGIRCADILQALNRLPDAQREIVLLVSVEGMSYQEVADRTNTPVGTVRSRLHRGRANLLALIDPEAAHGDSAPPASAKGLCSERSIRWKTSGRALPAQRLAVADARRGGHLPL